MSGEANEKTQVLPGDDAASVALAAGALAAGACVGMPTETVYGLACDALSARAVAGVFSTKGRPSFDPLIVHVRDAAHGAELAVFDATAATLAERFWPGPLTLVLPRRRVGDGARGAFVVPDLVTAGLDRVGLRVPDHRVAQALLRTSGLALAAPSANRFGSISPTTAGHVAQELGGRVGYVLDGGPCRSGVESTVVRIEPASAGGAGGVEVLRLGATGVEAIEAALPGVAVVVRASTSDPGGAGSAREGGGGAALPSPGMTDRHYAPRTPLRWVGSRAEAEAAAQHGRWGLLALGEVAVNDDRFAQVRTLSASGDLAEAAARLFATMRELDAAGLDGIVAVLLPEVGLGRAINDRLRRAGEAG
ncbi:MAG: L-threonylcarbamoyladenylate synthase [Phycisphaerales bacterium JB063]